jgi:serine protease Do
MSIDLRKRYKIANQFEGVVVTDVNGGLPTIAKSLLPGDVVVEVAQELVTSSDDFWIKLDRLKKAGRESALLSVARGGGHLRFVPLSLTGP